MAKAKDLRPFVERLITIAKRGLAVEGSDVTLNARRLVLRDVQDRVVVSKLFDSIAPRFASRDGGYTRLLRIGHRRGDNSEMAQVELIGSEFSPAENAEDASDEDTVQSNATEEATGKGVGDRLRKAAGRIRGKKSKETESS